MASNKHNYLLHLPDDLLISKSPHQSSSVEAPEGNEDEKFLGIRDESKDQLASESSIPLSPLRPYAKPRDTKMTVMAEPTPFITENLAFDKAFIGITHSPCYPELSPQFPEKKETLSLDAGFDQTPVLKDILGYYRDCESSSHIGSDLVRTYSNSKNMLTTNRKKLNVVYSKIAPSVVSVSSFHGLERKIDCSGLIVDWKSSENEATILTSAKVLLSLKNSKLEFHIIVRMADGTLLLAKEDRVDYYYKLLTLKVKPTTEVKVVDLRSRQGDIVEGMNVVALGRTFYTYSLLDFTGELYLKYPCFGCNELLTSTCCTSEICEGGPLITDTGYVVGVNFFCNFAHPLPTPVILTCLEMWRSFSTVVRPWVGMSVVDVNQLSYDILEKLNISPEGSYVVVKKVYEGSVADKNNVRSGDLVATLNGTLIQSVKQYSQLFLSETSQAACGDSCQQSFTVVINAFDRRIDNISIKADYISVEDKRLVDCWSRVTDGEWYGHKFGSQRNQLGSEQGCFEQGWRQKQKGWNQNVAHYFS